MIWHEKTLGWGVVVGLALLVVLAACSGSSAQSAEPEATAVVEAPTAEPTEEPVEPAATSEPVVVQDSDRVDAVVAALDASIEAGDAPEGLIAFDVLDSSVSEDGTVTLNICAWDGETVFDEVRDTLWQTDVNADGAISATHVTTPVAAGECLNTHLIETALATIEEFDAYLVEIDTEPARFAEDERTEELLGDGLREFLAPVFQQFVLDDVYLGNSRRAGPALEDLASELLWRRYERDEAVIEFAFCRPMAADYGFYRDGILLDESSEPEFPGEHSIDAIQLQPDPVTPVKWRVVGKAELVWSDCTSTQDWPGAASRWLEASTDFEVLAR